MRNSADAVIVGGGIIGAATAFYLAKANFGNIVLLEKESLLGTGATAKAAGGIRAQFATEDNIQMSMLSEKLFKTFEDDTGSKALFDQVGYLFLIREDKDVEVFERSIELQKSCGLNILKLTPDEIPQYAPHVSLEGVKFGTFCLDDGLGDPHEFLTGYDKGCRRMGVEIELETEVIGIDTNSGKIRTVKTNSDSKKFSLNDIRKKYSNAYGKWDSNEESKLIEMYTSGKKIDEIAVHLGRKTGGIKSRLKKLGIIK